ncbi:MAG: NAD(P)H-dependent oxidoreductase [Alphaproteobacteria bacterium]|nr:NAD(P)H-dependent oxidoreductase [Alphaproteobacteria bacterium]
MALKRILILNGHPAEASISRQFCEAYADAARSAGHEVRLLHLRDMDFDPDYGFAGYSQHKPLEPVLEQFLESLEWSEHFVLATPMWWGGIPAKLKGLIDRSFLPGRVFDTHVKPGTMPKPMLKGRTARVLLTTDTPVFFFRLLYKDALVWQLRGQILNFVGFKPARVSQFSGASHPKPETFKSWMTKIARMGKAGS